MSRQKWRLFLYFNDSSPSRALTWITSFCEKVAKMLPRFQHAGLAHFHVNGTTGISSHKQSCACRIVGASVSLSSLSALTMLSTSTGMPVSLLTLPTVLSHACAAFSLSSWACSWSACSAFSWLALASFSHLRACPSNRSSCPVPGRRAAPPYRQAAAIARAVAVAVA